MHTRLISILAFLLLPGIALAGNTHVKDKEFGQRRAQFLRLLAEENAPAVFLSAPEYIRNPDVEFPYRQDSDFYYLTGWEQHHAVILFNPGAEHELQLFVQPRNPKYEIWTGPRAGIEEAKDRMPDVMVHELEDFPQRFGSAIQGVDKLYVTGTHGHPYWLQIDSLREAAGIAADSVKDGADLNLHLRMFKSDAEIADLQKAVDITGRSLIKTFRKIPTLRHEYEVAAQIRFGFEAEGSMRLGFPSIVGSGVNSTYLHYSSNDQKLDQSGVVLMDVGAEWGYYSADITRTVPVNGSFSEPQKELYELVLLAQQMAIESIKPGVSFREPHNVAVYELTKGLLKLDLLEGEIDSLIARKDYRKYFMHGTSHWLGLDVHDVGGYKKSKGEVWTLQPGMVLTVEPGLYVKPGLDGVPERYWGIGIRIEDDVLVTESGNRILSSSIPSSMNEIEKLMRTRRQIFGWGK